MVNDIIVLRDKDLLLLFYMISVVDAIVKESDTAFKYIIVDKSKCTNNLLL